MWMIYVRIQIFIICIKERHKMDAEKELQQLRNRFRDLADKSFKQNVYTFSGFLSLGEQDVFWQMEKELKYVPYKLWGGMEHTDRKMLRFGSEEDLGYEEEYPIVCIYIRPLLAKFSNVFSHRDFLGALMNLGIERSTLGDILAGEKEGYLFCQDSIAEYICSNLDKIKHTNVKCQIVEEWKQIQLEEPLNCEVTVSSQRIDAVTAKIYNKSRNDILLLCKARRIYVNGRLCENNSRLLKQGETVNVRGFGKFIYQGICHETKKGKLCVRAAVYR